jgi:peptidoglycan/LPS O-acetylase OafA/YrhL
MLWPVFVMLLILWLAGVVAGYTMGGFIHLLLALAVIVLLAQVITHSEKEPTSAKTHTARHDAEKDARPDDEKVA